MAKVIDLEGVRRGDAHLERARQLNPNIGKRPVPVESIINGQRAAYTVSEVARLVSKHPLTIRRAIAAGELKASGGGKSHYRISRGDLEAWWRERGGGALLEDATHTEDEQQATPTADNGVAARLALLDAMTQDLPNIRAEAGFGPLSEDDISSIYDPRDEDEELEPLAEGAAA